jgi:hypothetical protein
MMEETKNQTAHNFFTEFFIIATWEIWKQRNDFIFNRAVPSFPSWKRSFCNEAFLQSTRMKPDISSAFLTLIEMYR